MTTEIKVRVRNGLVSVRLIKQGEKVSESGIVIPQTADGMTFSMAQVLEVGPGVLLDSGGHDGTSDLKVGDYVLVKTGQIQRNPNNPIDKREMRSYLDIDLGTQKRVVMNQSDVLMIVEGYVEQVEEPAPKLRLVDASGPVTQQPCQAVAHDDGNDMN